MVVPFRIILFGIVLFRGMFRGIALVFVRSLGTMSVAF